MREQKITLGEMRGAGVTGLRSTAPTIVAATTSRSVPSPGRIRWACLTLEPSFRLQRVRHPWRRYPAERTSRRRGWAQTRGQKRLDRSAGLYRVDKARRSGLPRQLAGE